MKKTILILMLSIIYMVNSNAQVIEGGGGNIALSSGADPNNIGSLQVQTWVEGESIFAVDAHLGIIWKYDNSRGANNKWIVFEGNVTHTGEIVGATNLVLQSLALTNKPFTALNSLDEFLIQDFSSGSLKRVSADDVLDNATHTGDVTGSGALTISNGAVDIAHLSATGTADASTYLRGDNTWGVPAGGGGGEINTASDEGTGGVGIILAKTGVNLPFKSLYAASNKLSIVDGGGNNRAEFNVIEANLSINNSQIPDFGTGVSANPDVAANTLKETNATHTGDVMGATALTIGDDKVTNAHLSNVDNGTIKGRNTAGVGNPEDLLPSEVRAIIGVEYLAAVDQDLGLVVGSSSITISGGTAVDLKTRLVYYDDDTAAASGGVVAEQEYKLTAANPYGQPIGTPRVRQ